MKTFQITIQVISIITLFALIPVSASDHIPVNDEFTDGEKFVNCDPNSESVEHAPLVLPESKTSSAKPFPTQAATSGKSAKPIPVAKGALSKKNVGILSQIFSLITPTQKDLKDSFNDDVGMGISNRR